MKIKFRFATSEDTQYFYNLILNEKIKISRQLGKHGFSSTDLDGNEYRCAFVVEIDGNRAGFAKVSGSALGGFNYLGTFYIAKKYRRQGIGTQLLKFVEDYALSNWHGAGVDLYTVDNPPMEKLIKKSGFKLSGIYKKSMAINGKYYSQSRWYKFYK